MKKYLLFFSLSLFISNFLYAQAPLVKQWDATFGGDSTEMLSALLQTGDGGFLLGGYSFSGKTGDKTQDSRGGFDYWIVKTDSLGNKKWDKRFGGTGDDYLTSIQQTTDGGYILGGDSNSGIGGDKTEASRGTYDYWVIKIDSLGNKQWDKRYGGNATDRFFTIYQTYDKGFIMGGHSSSGINGDKTESNNGYADYWIVKTDSTGNKQWDKRFGGNSVDYLDVVQQTPDKGYLLVGHSASGISGDKTQALLGENDYWIIKTDSIGNKQWDKTLGGAYMDLPRSIQQLSNKKYLIGGYSSSPIGGDLSEACRGDLDYWMLTIDSSGNKLWDKRFGGVSSDVGWGKVHQASDKTYLLSGYSQSNNTTGDKSEKNLGKAQAWIVKADSLGKKLWDKTILTNSETSYDAGSFGIQTPDDGYVVALNTRANKGIYKSQISHGGNDFWIIKFKDTTSCFSAPGIITAMHDTVCPGSAPVLTVTSGSADTQWQYSLTNADFGDLPGLTGAVCLDAPPQTGYYRAYSKNAACPDTSSTHRIIVTPGPLPAFSFQSSGSTVTFNSTPSSGSITNYSWDFSDGIYSTLPNPVHQYSFPDTFYVCLTVYNGINCPSVVCHDVPVDFLTGTQNVFDRTDWLIYPNPVNQLLIVNRSDYGKPGTIIIYNILDQVLYKSEIKAEQLIPVTSLPPGNYYITLQTTESVDVKRFIKL